MTQSLLTACVNVLSTTTGRKKTGKKMREQQRKKKKNVKGEKKQRWRKKRFEHLSECLCLRREPRIESGWRSGSFTCGRSGRTRCSHQCVREFSMMERKKKSIERIYCHCWLANVHKKKFIAIRIDSSCFLSGFMTISNVHSFNGFGYG